MYKAGPITQTVRYVNTERKQNRCECAKLEQHRHDRLGPSLILRRLLDTYMGESFLGNIGLNL